MINKKYPNAVSVKVNYNNYDDPKSRDDAVVRALKKLDNKLQNEEWQFDINRQRAHLTPRDRRTLKRRLVNYKKTWKKPEDYEWISYYE